MKKRFIPTIIALIILIILGVYANYYEVDEILAPGEVKSVQIVGFKEDDIKAISFGKNGNYDLKVELGSSHSKIVKPSEYKCDDAEAFGIARHFAELKSDYLFLNNATDTKIFGISSNSLSVMLETATQSVELTLGNKVEVGDSIYLSKKGDSSIYLVPSHIKGSFDVNLNDLRDRAFYYKDFDRCNEIQYKCGSNVFKLVFDAINSEWLIADTKYSAESIEVANLINNMRNLRISKFLDSNDFSNEMFGLTDPTLNIIIKTENGETYELKCGSMQGSDTYVSSDGKTVQMANTMKLNELKLSLNDIRDKFLDIYPYTELTEIEVKDATGTIKITKNKNKWTLGEINISDFDVRNFINTLSRAKVNEYMPKENLDKYGLANLENCPTITIKSNDKSKTFWLGDANGVMLFMLDEDEMININVQLFEGFKDFMFRLRNAELKVNK